MCGICGSTRGATHERLEAMNRLMIHRGPDDEGVYVDGAAGVGVAARRLSIIDRAGGHQPLSNEDGTVWAVLNGEIYNHPRLFGLLAQRGHTLATHTDTEVLVHLYEDYGPELAHALEGMFAFAIWDTRRRLLVLSRDRFGEKPLFLRRDADGLDFASELTALAAAGGTLELDEAAVDAYFTFGYVPGPGAIVRGVEQLAPGHTLVWDHDERRADVRRFWTPPARVARRETNSAALLAEMKQLLSESVESRLIADVPVGVFLSGGVDSTLVAALCARATKGEVPTFSVGYDTGSVGETAPAREAARAIGTTHHELVLTRTDVVKTAEYALAQLDQPLADPAFIALQALAVYARTAVTVAVGGEGADELFGGYPRYRWIARAQRVGLLPRTLASVGSRAIAGDSRRAARLLRAVAAPNPFVPHLEWVTAGRSALRELVYGPRLAERLNQNGYAGQLARVLDRAPGESVEGALMRLDQKMWLPDDVLMKADRATMQASVEMRTPFLQRELAEFAALVPPELHIGDGGKRLVRALLHDVLPGYDHHRKKTAFRVPVTEWLRGPLAAPFAERLDGRLGDDGWVNRSIARRMLDEHVSGRSDWSTVLWPLYALGTWLDGSGSVYA